MIEALLIAVALSGLGIVAYLYHGQRTRRLVQERLEDDELPELEEARAPARAQPFLRRYRWVAWLLAVFLVAGLYFLVGLHYAYAVTFGLIFGLLGGQLEASLAARKTARIESQLGDAIDLMVGALRAGASVLNALESATREVRAPLRPQLEEVLGRIRYGDDPQAVLRGLLARVPLETFRLFVTALSVHWEVGGSLALSLATVGRVIRDRVEVARRVRSLSAEARVSIIAVMAITYFIALIMWRTDPQRMREFVGRTIGRWLVAAALLLQAVGIVWSAAISRLKY